MNKVLKYNDREITITSYSTAQERDLLMSDDFNISFDILKNNIKSNKALSDLTKTEKFYVMLELRNISVGEVFSFISTCSKCGKKFETDVAFSSTLKEGKIEKYNDIEFIEAFSEEPNDYVDFDMDEMDLDEYDDLVEYINENKTQFNFVAKCFCHHCDAENSIELTKKHLLQNLSEDTLQNYYQTIASMVYYGHYSKTDIDSMLPFERSIYLSLLNEELKKENNNGL